VDAARAAAFVDSGVMPHSANRRDALPPEDQLARMRGEARRDFSA
jgi:hypothetical protein